jgi:hypothetical protein
MAQDPATKPATDEDPTVRADLVRRIQVRRRSVAAYLHEMRPKARRLITISLVSSAIAAVLTAGPALGGEGFAEGVADALSLPEDSVVWRVLCLLSTIVSVVAAISNNLSKSQDRTANLSAAEAASTELEGLEAMVEFGHLPVEDAVKLYQQYVAKIPFVDEGALPG